ncbi:hypothetical protein P7C70_g9196, partial [Phenoliferia sp. Uapishka_3]
VEFITASGISGGNVVADTPLSVATKQFLIAASPGDGRSMSTQFARVRRLAPEDAMRFFFRFEVDREIEEGLDFLLPGNATPTHARLFLYAQSNARDPQLRGELSKLYRNPRFHFQFTLALYYEILEAQGRLLAAGAQRIREVTIDTADTRARGKSFISDLNAWNRGSKANLRLLAPSVSGLLDGPRAQAASMGVVNSGVGQMSELPKGRLRKEEGGADKKRQSAATTDPRVRPTAPQPASPNGRASSRQPQSLATPVSVPMSRGAEMSIPSSSSGTDSPTAGKSLTRSQRRRRNQANRKLALAASTAEKDSTITSTIPITPPRLPTHQAPAAKAPQAQFVAPPTPPTTPHATRAPYPQATYTPSPRVNAGSRFSPPNYRYSPLGRPLAGPHKRQHSPPPSSSSNSKFGSNARYDTEKPRQSPSMRHQQDWRTQMGPRMASSSNGNGNSGGTTGQTSATGSPPLQYPNLPPPFSWDHVVHTRSRAVVYNPTFQPSNASNGASASSSQASAAPPSSYVPSSKPQKTYADIVFGRSGASITPSSGTLLPSAPLRTGGNRLDPSKLPSATAFAPAQATQLPMASSSLPLSSSPTYVATFATIPRTIEANTLQDLQHGVDDCNTYPTLSDISEMPDEDLGDDEGEFTEVVSKKTRKSARLTAKVSNSNLSLLTPLSSNISLTQRSTPQPAAQREHSYNGKGKQRARYQGSDKS